MGDFKYASSFYLQKQQLLNVVMQCLNLKMLIDLDKSIGFAGETETIFSDDDKESVSSVYHAKFKQKQDKNIVVPIRIKARPLDNYELLQYDKKTRNSSIIKAIGDGYKQSELAEYLGLSSVLISKVVKQHRIKIALFNELKNKGLFWVYVE